MKEKTKCICGDCKCITLHTAKIVEKEVPNTGKTVEVIGNLCDICGKLNSYPHEGLELFQAVIKEHKANAPSIDEVLIDLPEKRRRRWVNHFDDSIQDYRDCTCSEEEKGVECDEHLTKYYYSRSEWMEYLKKHNLEPEFIDAFKPQK